MEKFAVDLDKLLDDLESDDVPNASYGVAASKDGGIPARPLDAWKPQALLPADGSGVAAELIDLSDADFGPTHVTRPNPVIVHSYGHLSPMTQLLAASFTASVGSTGDSVEHLGPEPWEDSFSILSSTGLSDHGYVADKLSQHNQIKDQQKFLEANVSLTEPHLQTSSGTVGKEHSDGKVFPNEFNPLDSEPHFGGLSSFHTHLPSSSSPFTWTDAIPNASELACGIEPLTNGAVAKQHHLDAGSLACRPWGDGNGLDEEVGKGAPSPMGSHDQSNSLLLANGIHVGCSLNEEPGLHAGMGYLMGSLSASSAGAPAFSSLPATDPAYSSAAHQDSNSFALRFDDIRINEHDDDSLEAYLANVSHVQLPAHHHNALLEANLGLDTVARTSKGNIMDKAAEFGCDEGHVTLPTLQENALLQANLVGTILNAADPRDDAQSNRTNLFPGWPGCSEDTYPRNGSDLIGSSGPLMARQGAVSNYLKHTTQVAAAECQPAISNDVLSVPQSPTVPVGSTFSGLQLPMPTVGASVNRTSIPNESTANGTQNSGGSTGKSEGNSFTNGVTIVSVKEHRRPTSLLGLSKVALNSAAADDFASASHNGLTADSKVLSTALGETGEDLTQAGDLVTANSLSNTRVYAHESVPQASTNEHMAVHEEVGAVLNMHSSSNANGNDQIEPPADALQGAPQPATGGINGNIDEGHASSMPVEWDDLGATKPLWVPDSDAAGCMNCNAKFTFTKRRHHCRACGRVFCALCCNMKSRLLYLDFKEARVCSKCHEQLALGELRQRELLGQQLPADPHAAHSASAFLPAVTSTADDPGSTAAAAADSTPGQANPPSGVLRRSGSRGGQSKTVMFSDGIRPGGDLTHLDGSARDPASPAASASPSQGASHSEQGHQRTKTRKKRNSLGDLIKPKTAFIIPKSGLPPVLFFTDSHARDYVIDENPDSDLLFEAMKDQSGESNFAFVIHKDLRISVKLVQLDCCAKKLCWCFTSKGLCTVGQEEVVVILECVPDEKEVPSDIFYFYRMLYEQTFKGVAATELGFTICAKEMLRKSGEGFLGNKDHGGFLFVRPTFQCLQGLSLPPAPYLVAVLLDKWELPWAKVFPLRLALRLGAEYRYYPCPLISIRGRKPVYGEIGHTIMNLLADFRNYQYTLGHVDGVTVHLQDKVTVISFPKNKYNEIYKILSNSNDYVFALGANFSSEADSHLVCVQTEEGTYQTQAINIQDKPRKVTGASFVVFSGALKTGTPGVVAKSSIVEDGLMVQILPEAMVELKNKIKNMQDHSIRCGSTQQHQAADGTEEAVYIKWVDEYKKFNLGVSSPIDGFPLDGIESMRIYGYAEVTSSSRRSIRWTEVFFLQNDELGNNPADPVDLSRLGETVAGSCMAAISPHLETLKDNSMTKIGLRVTLGTDQVGYEIGSNGSKLPTHLLNDLDNELVPVIHSTASSLSSGSLTVLELVFHVLE